MLARIIIIMTLISPSRPEVIRSRRIIARARVERLLSRKEEVVTEKFLSFQHFSFFYITCLISESVIQASRSPH